VHVGCSGVDFPFGVDVKVNAPARQTAIDYLDGCDLDNAMALLGIESRRFGVEDDVTHEPSVRDDPPQRRCRAAETSRESPPSLFYRR